MAKSKRVEFKTSEGIILRGDFYQANGDKRPIVIMTAGLTLTNEHNIGAMAEKFQEGGISALAFDYRCWGSSDGTPRQEANLLQEAEDYRDAVTAAKAAVLPRSRPDAGEGRGGGWRCASA